MGIIEKENRSYIEALQDEKHLLLWLSGSEPVERDNNEESMRARDPNHRIPNWEFLDDDEFQV